MIAIIDYGAGNLRSVEKALTAIGEESIVTRDRDEILNADKVILPGVGAFGDAMDSLKKYELDKVIHEVCDMDKPFLGICLGPVSYTHLQMISLQGLTKGLFLWSMQKLFLMTRLLRVLRSCEVTEQLQKYNKNKVCQLY